MFSIKGGTKSEGDGSTEESLLDIYWLHKIKWGHCFWPLPSFAHRKITWFPCIGSKTTDCRIIIKGGQECWLGVWMERCYQKSGFASWGLLNQKLQLSQSSSEGKVYYLKKYGEHQGVFQSNVSSNYSSVQFSCSVMSNSLRPHKLQHARPPCPSPTPGVHSDSCPSSQWCHPAISSSVVPFSSCPNPSQHQSLFQWVNSSHEVAKVLEFQL